MSIVIVEILIVLALFTAHGMFAMSETALVCARKSRLRQMAADGHPGAPAALRLASAPNRFLPTVQVGITLVGLLAGALGGATLAGTLADTLRPAPFLTAYADALSVGLVVLALTFVSVLIGELTPKRLALSALERIACHVARPVEWLSRIAQPVVHLLGAATGQLLRLCRIAPGPPDHVSEEEVHFLLREGSASGVFHQDEPRMVESVLSFDCLPVSEIMTPGAKLVLLGPDEPSETLWRKIVAFGHSSYPVVDADNQSVLGVVTVKSLFANLAAHTPARVGDLMTPALRVAAAEPVRDVLDRFKRTGVHFAVVGETGGPAAGVVTHVDLLEAIGGDMPSLEERLRPQARQRPDGTWLVDGHFNLAKLDTLLGVNLQAHAAGGAPTLAALIGKRLEGHPREGDTFTCAGLQIEIMDMDRTSVDKVLIQPERAPNARRGRKPAVLAL